MDEESAFCMTRVKQEHPTDLCGEFMLEIWIGCLLHCSRTLKETGDLDMYFSIASAFTQMNGIQGLVFCAQIQPDVDHGRDKLLVAGVALQRHELKE